VRQLTYGSLFSGIGGIDLGFDRAGMRCLWQCEIDPYACRVLEKHWPGVKRYGDITKVDWSKVERPDVICGGFPCQDISFAGKGAGLSGKRSGLWYEFARCISDIRPRYIFVENVSALLVRGMDAVLGTLAEVGYDAEWHCIPAYYIGLPHIRDRVWIIANANAMWESQSEGSKQYIGGRDYFGTKQTPSNFDRQRLQERILQPGIQREKKRIENRENATLGSWWNTEPALVRRLHGIPNRVDRIKSLGNAVVPPIAELIGKAIIQADALTHS